jgi:hypothetical protein
VARSTGRKARAAIMSRDLDRESTEEESVEGKSVEEESVEGKSVEEESVEGEPFASASPLDPARLSVVVVSPFIVFFNIVKNAPESPFSPREEDDPVGGGIWGVAAIIFASVVSISLISKQETCQKENVCNINE